ncbi:MAG: WYL domain-containing protein [Alphaproteobacteria bacterium]|nr:WYL domain-containing protein [Alphaproteobacteria bacterium]
MFEKLLARLRGRAAGFEIPEPVFAVPFETEVSDLDEDEVYQGYTLEDCIGAVYGLEYIDAKGARSRRRVTLRGVGRGVGRSDEADDVYYLRGYCHERKAPRIFRSDRIVSLTHLGTGEVIEAFEDFLAELHARDDTSVALADLRPAVNVLAFLGWCDGDFAAKERAEIVRYVLTQHGDAEEDRVRAYVDVVHPDPDTFHDSLDRISGWNATKTKAFLRAVKRVADADKIISTEEMDILMEIGDVVKS